MKYLISLCLILGFSLAPVTAHAQVIIINGPKATERVAPTLEDYEKVLEFYKKATKESVSLDAWKGRELVHKYSKEKLSFDKLSNYEKHMFLMAQGYRLNVVELSNFNKHWSNELKKFDNPKYEPKKREKIDNPKQNPATKADVEKYLKELTNVRKESAKKYEKFVEKVCNDFKEDIPEKERDLYLKEIREFNDENKLIERKK